MAPEVHISFNATESVTKLSLDILKAKISYPLKLSQLCICLRKAVLLPFSSFTHFRSL